MANQADQVKTSYQLGMRVKGTVYRVLPTGLLLRLPDGVSGIIRPYELSWSRRPPNPRDVARESDELEAVILEIEPESGGLNLSLRLLERDPWENIEQKYPPGTEVTGEVIGLMPYGAFVEIEPGIKGLVHISQVDLERKPKRIEECLLLGDRVKALVIRLEPERQRIDLSIKAYLEKAHLGRTLTSQKAREPSTVSLEEFLGRKMATRLRQMVGEVPAELEEPPEEMPKPGRIRDVLIVDDHPVFLSWLKSWFQDLGYSVQEAVNGTVAIELATSDSPDLILSDLRLPDMDGLEVARRIFSSKPDVPLLLVSGFEVSPEEMEEVERLGLPLLFKPLDIRELGELLKTFEQEGRLPKPVYLPRIAKKEVALFQQATEVLEIREELPQTLGKLSAELMKRTGAAASAVFAMDSETLEVSVIAQGNFTLRDEAEAKHTLQHSPVHDVMRDNRPLMENDTARVKSRFHYLLKAFSFSSCVGVPIPTLTDTITHTLFLFHPRPHHFSRSHLARALTVANLMGMAIAREKMERRLREAQQVILAGQLSYASLHEVNNRLGGVAIGLQYLLDKLERQRNERKKELSYEEIEETIWEIRNTVNSVLDAVHLFRLLSQAEVYELLDVNDCIRRVADSLGPLAQNNRVQIQLNLAPDLPQTVTVSVRLDQVFYNVMLNAIEWLAYRTDAVLEVTTTYEPDAGPRPIRVRIKDNGPGIHRQHFERIYEMGFTNKPEGMGLGLFVAKGLVESLGGRISVEESIIQVGTTFLIELKLIAPTEGGTK